MNFVKVMKTKLKGFLGLDLLVALIFIAVLVIGSIITSFMFFNLFDSVESSNPTLNTTFFDNARGGIDALNYQVPLIIVALFIGILILNYYIDSHPVFLIWSFIWVLIITLFAAAISNFLEILAGTTGVAATASRYPITFGLLTQLPIITLIFGSVAIMVLYGKKREATG